MVFAAVQLCPGSVKSLFVYDGRVDAWLAGGAIVSQDRFIAQKPHNKSRVPVRFLGVGNRRLASQGLFDGPYSLPRQTEGEDFAHQLGLLFVYDYLSFWLVGRRIPAQPSGQPPER